MSFNFEFIATKQDAVVIVATEHAPDCVKEFIIEALTAFKADEMVLVKAVGHLYHNDYDASTAEIKVHRVTLRKPK